MKIPMPKISVPSFLSGITVYKLERVLRMAPIIKDVFTPTPTESESKAQINKLEDVVHNKNAEIFKLRQERKVMKRLIFSSNTRIKDLEKQVWDLEQNVENCSEALKDYRSAIGGP